MDYFVLRHYIRAIYYDKVCILINGEKERREREREREREKKERDEQKSLMDMNNCYH